MDEDLLEIYKRHYGGEILPSDIPFLNDVSELIEILRRIINGNNSIE